MTQSIPTNRSELSDEQTMRGGDYLEVHYLPQKESNDNSPTSETLLVRQMPLSTFDNGTYQRSLGHTSREIALYADKPAAWADTLTLPSQQAILELGRQLNFPTLRYWVAHNHSTANELLPLIQSTLPLNTLEPLVNTLLSSLSTLESSRTSSTANN